MKLLKQETDSFLKIFSHLITLVSSCALARLSTAMAKNTFSRVSGHKYVKESYNSSYTLTDVLSSGTY